MDKILINESIFVSQSMPKFSLRERASGEFLTDQDYHHLIKHYQNLMFEKYQLQNPKRENITLDNPY